MGVDHPPAVSAQQAVDEIDGIGIRATGMVTSPPHHRAVTIVTTAQKTIGVLTSGGDCAGLNAVIRAVVARAVEGHGWRVLGIHQGTQGLLRRPVDAVTLDLQSANPGMARMAGTILGTTNRETRLPFRCWTEASRTVRRR
jgi:Phosphofructokinase